MPVRRRACSRASWSGPVPVRHCPHAVGTVPVRWACSRAPWSTLSPCGGGPRAVVGAMNRALSPCGGHCPHAVCGGHCPHAVRLSRGMIQKLVRKVSESLADPYDELLDAIAQQSHLNVDETGHKENGVKLWTWCFRAYLFTVFKISPNRGSADLVETLGAEFEGTIGCDYFSAYRKFMRLDENVKLQFCIAHLIRDIKFLCEHPDEDNRVYGTRLREHFRKLFRTIARRDEFASETTFRQSLERIRDEIVWDATVEQPDTRHAANMAERFYRHFEDYFRFISDPAIDPTNNLAEQAIRFVAIHRRMTQGTRSESGRTWFERICTAAVTCEQRGRSAFDFLVECVTSHFSGTPAPSLLPIATDTS